MAHWDPKYIVTELKADVGDAPWTPAFKETESNRVLSLDSKVLQGAFYVESAWFWPGNWPENKGDEGTIKEHAHDYPEVVAFIGSDPKDVTNLCGEVEFWIDGKQNIIDKSFLAFLPAGTRHGPLRIRRADKAIFHFTAGMGTSYT